MAYGYWNLANRALRALVKRRAEVSALTARRLLGEMQFYVELGGELPPHIKVKFATYETPVVDNRLWVECVWEALGAAEGLRRAGYEVLGVYSVTGEDINKR